MGRFPAPCAVGFLCVTWLEVATDVILPMCYAKTTHGRLFQQFGPPESTGGRGLLLDALALADHSLILCRPLVPKIWMKNDCTSPVLGS